MAGAGEQRRRRAGRAASGVGNASTSASRPAASSEQAGGLGARVRRRTRRAAIWATQDVASIDRADRAQQREVATCRAGRPRRTARRRGTRRHGPDRRAGEAHADEQRRGSPAARSGGLIVAQRPGRRDPARRSGMASAATVASDAEARRTARTAARAARAPIRPAPGDQRAGRAAAGLGERGEQRGAVLLRRGVELDERRGRRAADHPDRHALHARGPRTATRRLCASANSEQPERRRREARGHHPAPAEPVRELAEHQQRRAPARARRSRRRASAPRSRSRTRARRRRTAAWRDSTPAIIANQAAADHQERRRSGPPAVTVISRTLGGGSPRPR